MHLIVIAVLDLWLEVSMIEVSIQDYLKEIKSNIHLA